MDAHSFKEVDAEWADDGLSAVLQRSDGSWLAHLRVEQWYGSQQLEARLAWVVSWLDPHAATPTMLSAAIEIPALTADDGPRRAELVERALGAMAGPPTAPEPFAAPAPTPGDADEWSEHFDLQLACWDSAFGELVDARKDMGSAGDLSRYRALTQTLDWAYALDKALTLLWRSLPEELREEESSITDERARKAAEHNARGRLPFNIETDPAFAGYVRRRQDRQPYRHWAELMLAGVFQADFFLALGWTRGQLIHAATSAPMDLRQLRPGAEPRWKWRESDVFARGRPADAGRRAYDRLLAGHDVVGLLGHLHTVFFEAALELRRLLRRVEA